MNKYFLTVTLLILLIFLVNYNFVLGLIVGIAKTFDNFDYENSLSGKENLKRAISLSWKDLREKAKERKIDLQNFEGPIWREIGEPQEDVPPKFLIIFFNRNKNWCYQYDYIDGRGSLMKWQSINSCVPEKDTNDPYKFKGTISRKEIENFMESAS
jgi:hypothetical protein